MTREQIEDIIASRIVQWGVVLRDMHATPMLLLGVGHDHAVGKLHVVVPDSVGTQEIKAMLLAALEMLDKGQVVVLPPEGR